jgi:hypothetical protein
MVIDLRLKGMVGKRGLMFVSYYGRYKAFIANYSSWQEYHNDGRIAEIASSLISHEALHLVLNKFSLTASAKLDNLFGKSNTWENYPHGLGDIDRVNSGIPSNYKSGQKSHQHIKRRRMRH